MMFMRPLFAYIHVLHKIILGEYSKGSRCTKRTLDAGSSPA